MEVSRLPLRSAAGDALVPELVEPIRRRPARHRYEAPAEHRTPPPTPIAGYGDPRPPLTGLLLDVYC